MNLIPLAIAACLLTANARGGETGSEDSQGGSVKQKEQKHEEAATKSKPELVQTAAGETHKAGKKDWTFGLYKSSGAAKAVTYVHDGVIKIKETAKEKGPKAVAAAKEGAKQTKEAAAGYGAKAWDYVKKARDYVTENSYVKAVKDNSYVKSATEKIYGATGAATTYAKQAKQAFMAPKLNNIATAFTTDMNGFKIHAALKKLTHGKKYPDADSIYVHVTEIKNCNSVEVATSDIGHGIYQIGVRTTLPAAEEKIKDATPSSEQQAEQQAGARTERSAPARDTDKPTSCQLVGSFGLVSEDTAWPFTVEINIEKIFLNGVFINNFGRWMEFAVHDTSGTEKTLQPCEAISHASIEVIEKSDELVAVTRVKTFLNKNFGALPTQLKGVPLYSLHKVINDEAKVTAIKHAITEHLVVEFNRKACDVMLTAINRQLEKEQRTIAQHASRAARLGMKRWAEENKLFYRPEMMRDPDDPTKLIKRSEKPRWPGFVEWGKAAKLTKDTDTVSEKAGEEPKSETVKKQSEQQ